MDRTKQVAKSSLQVIVLTIIMKLAAFLKQTILANYFGASTDVDLYLLASDTLGDFSVALFSALSVSVMTLYTRYVVKKEEKEAEGVVNTAIKIFVPFSIIFAVLFYTLSEQISSVLAAYYSCNEQLVVAHYIRIVCPTIIFLCIAYLNIAVLDAHQKFWPGKMINFILSMIIILATLVFGKKYGVRILAYAYTLAYFVNMLFIFVCNRRNYCFRIKSRVNREFVKPLITMFIPMFMGNAAVEINALVDKYVATSIGGGALSAQTYGTTLNSFVVSIFITAPTGVLVSYLSLQLAKGEKREMNNLVLKALVSLIMILMPVTVITISNYRNIVEIIYHRGAFDDIAVRNTSISLLGYSFGFIFTLIREVLIKVHLAYRDSRMVMINGLISVGINIVTSIILVKKVGIIGISIGTSVAAFVGMLLTINSSRRYLLYFDNKKLYSELIKMLVAGGLGLGVALGINKAMDCGHLALLIISSFCVFLIYLLVLLLEKSSSILYAGDLLKNRLHRKRMD